MNRNITHIALAAAVLLFSQPVWADNGDELTQLDDQREQLLDQITNELAYGHISPSDAEKNKDELDKIVSMETTYKEGGAMKLRTISLALDKIKEDIKESIHPNKVWMGIDTHNMALKQKIDRYEKDNKLTREEADDLGRQEQVLRDRETVSDTSQGLEFDDAITLAHDIQNLDQKIDELANN